MEPLLTVGLGSRVSITFNRRQHGGLQRSRRAARELLLAARRCWWLARRVSSPKSAFLKFRHSFRARARQERSEEHTSELQSHLNLVCRLLLEKKKKQDSHSYY